MTPNNLADIRYNLFGYSTHYDYRPMVKWAETDTSLAAISKTRILQYTGEKHTDSLSASELGSILHLTDIGDVSGDDVADGSFLVYSKDSDCGEGCVGINNSWVAWNALDELVDELTYVMGFDGDGVAQTLNYPLNTDEYYTLSWRAGEKAGWTQAVEATTPPTDSDDYAYMRFLDPDTKQEIYVKVKVTVADDGTWTITGA